MPAVLIKFIIRLGEPNFSGGPLFHRWLPRGIQDSIETRVASGELRLWFERRGYTEKGMVRFDFRRNEVDDSILAKQGRLDAGPLFGTLTLQDVSGTALDVLRRDVTGDAEYLGFGKTIIKSLYLVLARVVEHLRIRYGQYWLTPLEKWDSRYRSIGAICEDWNMCWSEDNGTTWHPFKPDKSVRKYGPLDRTKFDEYMTQSDWAALKESVEKSNDPPLAAELVTNAHRLASEFQLRHALVEACSALEIAISKVVRTRIKASKQLTDSVASFLKDTPLKARLVTVAALLTTLPNTVLEEALEGIELRNRVVHDGAVPEERDRRFVRAVLEVVKNILPDAATKFPVLSGSNFVVEPETWEKTGGYDPIVAAGITISEA